MSGFTRIHNRFEYHLEDLNCHDCVYYTRRTKSNPLGCGYDPCPYDDIRCDCIENGRIKRPRGWFSSAGG